MSVEKESRRRDNMGWMAVDLDGTLAHYDKFISPSHIGEPIAPMVARVKKWLSQGKEVRIFTARVWFDSVATLTVAQEAIAAIDQ